MSLLYKIFFAVNHLNLRRLCIKHSKYKGLSRICYKITSNLGDVFKKRGVNPSGLNFDDLSTKNGIYWINLGTSEGTFPVSETYGMLLVFSLDNAEAVQFFANENHIYSRFNVNKNWSVWQALNN